MTKTLPRVWGYGARPMVFLKLVEARASKLKLELQRASTSFNELQRASLSSFIFCEALKNQKNEKKLNGKLPTREWFWAETQHAKL